MKVCFDQPEVREPEPTFAQVAVGDAFTMIGDGLCYMRIQDCAVILIGPKNAVNLSTGALRWLSNSTPVFPRQRAIVKVNGV